MTPNEYLIPRMFAGMDRIAARQVALRLRNSDEYAKYATLPGSVALAR